MALPTTAADVVVELDSVVVPDEEPAVDVLAELLVDDEVVVDDELLVDDDLLVDDALLVDDEVVVDVAGVTPHVACPI